jgi:hypothetical protein
MLKPHYVPRVHLHRFCLLLYIIFLGLKKWLEYITYVTVKMYSTRVFINGTPFIFCMKSVRYDRNGATTDPDCIRHTCNIIVPGSPTKYHMHSGAFIYGSVTMHGHKIASAHLNIKIVAFVFNFFPNFGMTIIYAMWYH